VSHADEPERGTSVLRSVAPILPVSDVERVARWYSEVLGFRAHLFPKAPPYVFAVLGRDGVEIMLQATRADVATAQGGAGAYLRMNGVVAFYRQLVDAGQVGIAEPLSRKPSGDTEFAIRDPDGHLLVFSELLREGR
jgi:catechol 2,3-dioxygenase-like lactoylglutathione lyase family enzyme